MTKSRVCNAFRPLAQPRAAFLLLCIFGFIWLGVCDGDVESIPGELRNVILQLQQHFCEGCNGSWGSCKTADSKRCPICSEICPKGRKAKDDIDAMCYENKCTDVTLCGVEECEVCLFKDAKICEYDNDDVCVFDDFNRTYCVCDDILEPVVDKSCIDRRRELSTPPVSTMQSPASQVNIQAVVLGSVLAMVLVSVVLGVFCFCPKDKLRCTRSNRATDGRKRKDPTRQPVALASLSQPRQDTAMANPTYAVPITDLPQDQGKIQARWNLESGTPKNGHNGGQSVTPSAPPIEHLESSTEARGGQDVGSCGYRTRETIRAEHGVSLHEAKANQSLSQNQHEYFTLEPQVDIDETTAGGESTDYNHVKRLPERQDDGSGYSHLSANPGYDRVSRSGHTQPEEGAVGQFQSGNEYDHLEYHNV